MQLATKADRTRASHGGAGEPLALRLLGPFSVTIGGRELPLATRKAKALLGYLALSDDAGGTREHLVGLFWSERDEERARASLRQAVHEIKVACYRAGFNGFVVGKQALALRSGFFASDVDAIHASLARQEVHHRLLQAKRLPETLLENFDDLDPGFEVWLRTKRQLLHDRLTLALETLLPLPTLDAAAMALLNIDPTHEPACRRLITARAARGDIGGAMQAYKALWDVLEADFDVEPSKETQDLIVSVREFNASNAAAASSGGVDTAPGRPEHRAAPPGSSNLSLSIYPFDAGGVRPDRRYIVGGFRHELVACLARFRDWSVRALPQHHPPEIPDWSSPPQYLIEGTTYEVGGAIRLIITFRDAATSICIWSDQFTLDLETWFDTQQRIVRKIATALNVHLSAERLRRYAAETTTSLDVHDRWLRGQALVHHLSSADWGTAATIFESIVRDAPDFAPGLTSLVQLRNTEHIAKPGLFRDRTRYHETLQQARHAAQLDPLDSRAQLNLAWTHQLAGHGYEAALHAALAVELNGNDSWTLMSAGQIFAYGGDHVRAEELAAASLDGIPVVTPQQMTYLAAIRFLSGEYAGCVEAAAQGLATSPGFRVWPCAALAHLGRRTDASAELAHAFVEVGRDWHGAGAPSKADMSAWMLHMFPLASEGDWQRLRHGLALAGAPVSALRFEAS